MCSLTYERLLELVIYNSKEGKLYSKVRTSRRKIGEELGCNKGGYLFITLDSKEYLLHNIIWFLETGNYPITIIDHIDTNKLNNVYNNLREANHSLNGANSPMSSNNTSGFKGVSFLRGKWIAQIRVNKKLRYLGIRNTPQEAAILYDKAALEYFGEYALTNKQLGVLV